MYYRSTSNPYTFKSYWRCHKWICLCRLYFIFTTLESYMEQNSKSNVLTDILLAVKAFGKIYCRGMRGKNISYILILIESYWTVPGVPRTHSRNHWLTYLMILCGDLCAGDSRNSEGKMGDWQMTLWTPGINTIFEPALHLTPNRQSWPSKTSLCMCSGKLCHFSRSFEY